MTLRTKTAWLAEMNRLLQINIDGEIEADEHNLILTDLADSVTFIGVVPPSIMSFGIQGVSSVVDSGFSLSGSQTFEYNVATPEDLNNGTIDQEGVEIASGVDPAASSVAATVTTFTLNAGEKQTFTLEFPVIAGGIVTKIFEIDVRPTAEYLYYGEDADGDPANFNPSANERAILQPSGETFTLPTFSGDAFLVIAQPAIASALTAIEIGGVNQIAAFTLTEDAFTFDSQLYDAWVSTNELVGSAVSGQSVTVRR